LIIPLPTADTVIAVVLPVVLDDPVTAAPENPVLGEYAVALTDAMVVAPKLLKPNDPPLG
jgi:hypothetical protein